MAFFYFALTFGLGTIAFLHGIGLFSTLDIQKGPQSLPAGVNPIEHQWYKEPLLYFVIAMNIAYAYYKYIKKKNENKK